MTVRGTSNQTGLTRVSHVVSVLDELGPGDDQGGNGFPRVAGEDTVYKESDNSTGSLGMVFTKGNKHLPWGTPQADRQPA